MRTLIGCDFGGGASKATLLREDGVILATASCEYPTAYPAPGWAEQNPDDSLAACLQNIRRLLADTGTDPASVAALALDGATHTAVLLDDCDRVIRPAIYWTDRRSAAEAAALERDYGKMLREKSFNAPSAFWTLPQLMWLSTHDPESFAKIRRVLSMKDYVRYRLTGDYVTDSIEAMGFLLEDARGGVWDDTLCALCGLSPAVLPEIVPPTQVLSPICAEMCRETGLTPATRVIAGSTDTCMEVLAAGAVKTGQATVKLATAGRICAITDRPTVSPLLVTYRHAVPDLWYPGTATKAAASSFRWLRDTLKGFSYAELDALIAAVAPGSEGLFFHPYLQGEITPYLDDSLRASFVGLTARHSTGHLARAVLEGVGYSLKACKRALDGLSIPVEEAAIIGGGSKSALWRQITADMLQIPLVKNRDDDSSLGSCMLAGVASGIFADFASAAALCVHPSSRVEPKPQSAALYDRLFPTYERIHDALAPIYHSL